MTSRTVKKFILFLTLFSVGFLMNKNSVAWESAGEKDYFPNHETEKPL